MAMTLRTRLIVAATTVVFAIVVVLSFAFLGELLRQRIAQTAVANDVMARQVLQMTRQAVIEGLAAHPPAGASDADFEAAVADALRRYQPLSATMNGLVRYSDAVQDVSVADAHGTILAATDPLLLGQPAPARPGFDRVRGWRLVSQVRELLGRAHVLDVSQPLNRNGRPFLVVHVGVRSTFLRASYGPWLRDAALLALLGTAVAITLAALLAAVALRPIEQIGARLESLTVAPTATVPQLQTQRGEDAVVRVAQTIDRLDMQMRQAESGLSDLQTNLDRMLDTLRDGVVLFDGSLRAVMVSDAAARFVPAEGAWAGRTLAEIFLGGTALGEAVQAAVAEGDGTAQAVQLEDGRRIEFSLDRIGGEDGRASTGTLLTLRDVGSAQRLEQELEVSRRLAAVGRLTAGVGHEVKNPINAMVVHLELLRTKLEAAAGAETLAPAMRHVDILAGEMRRLDRVVETLTDFTRPVELDLRTLDLGEIAVNVVELTEAEMAAQGVTVRSMCEPVAVHADGELLRQALLNVLLNGMQAMPGGGILTVTVQAMANEAILTVEDEGAGIAPEVLPRIFDLYFTTRAGGSGIGLAMTYRIVHLHGGSLAVESEPGRGTCFTMRLPAVTALRAKWRHA